MKRILHFGIGNFHRAHQAWYTHHAEMHAQGWTITGLSFRSPKMRDQLKEQDFTYTLVTRDASGDTLELIAEHDDIVFVPEERERVLALISDPATHVITLTITEKGYPFGLSGKLDIDALGPDPMDTPLGILAHGLSMRDRPITILSCDNLPQNGDRLRAGLRAYATHAFLEIPGPFSCPNTMVDRIVPATTDELRALVREKTGMEDASPVETERFSEWVIEDRFAGPRPAWDQVGVTFVPDVAPYELRKLRMLNGAHSTLAYCGLNAGYEFVHEAVGDAELEKLVKTLMKEAASTLPADVETELYSEALMVRFSNPALHHSLRQIAMDGTLKLPIRILRTMANRKARGLESPACAQALQGWLDFVKAETKAGRSLDDPSSEALAEAANSGDDRALLMLLGLQAHKEPAYG